MKKSYKLDGMSCEGCKNNVKRALMQLPEIEEADVQLHPQRAVLTMSQPVDVDILQAQLRKVGHYTIMEANTKAHC